MTNNYGSDLWSFPLFSSLIFCNDDDTVSRLDDSISTDMADPINDISDCMTSNDSPSKSSRNESPTIWAKLGTASQGAGGGIGAGAVIGIGASVIVFTGGTALVAGAGAVSGTVITNKGTIATSLVAGSEAAGLFACPAGVSAILGGSFGTLVGGIAGAFKGWAIAGTSKNAFYEGAELAGKVTAKAAAIGAAMVAVAAVATAIVAEDTGPTEMIHEESGITSNTTSMLSKRSKAFPLGRKYGYTKAHTSIGVPNRIKHDKIDPTDSDSNLSIAYHRGAVAYEYGRQLAKSAKTKRRQVSKSHVLTTPSSCCSS